MVEMDWMQRYGLSVLAGRRPHEVPLSGGILLGVLGLLGAGLWWATEAVAPVPPPAWLVATVRILEWSCFGVGLLLLAAGAAMFTLACLAVARFHELPRDTQVAVFAERKRSMGCAA